MPRISREVMFMEMAEIAARRATCYRGNTGAVVVADRDILSCGYNGPPPGDEHCKGNQCELSIEGGCLRSVHAEWNAIDRASKKKSSLEKCDLFCTSAPCKRCADAIFLNKIACLYYRYPYRDELGLHFLLNVTRIAIYRITPAGILINVRSGQIE